MGRGGRLAACLLLAGLSILLYPFVMNGWNRLQQRQALRAYTAQAELVDAGPILEEARRWNLDRGSVSYEGQLDPLGSGMMGILEIPAIELLLPIGHGVQEEILAAGVGHLPWSSLPVGGAGSHCVLSGHRGLPTARLFTDLDKLALGDEFILHILDVRLVYRVDRILVVEPWDTEHLKGEEGEDCCTLLTCTPYGINSHRLLVRGRRVA